MDDVRWTILIRVFTANERTRPTIIITIGNRYCALEKRLRTLLLLLLFGIVVMNSCCRCCNCYDMVIDRRDFYCKSDNKKCALSRICCHICVKSGHKIAQIPFLFCFFLSILLYSTIENHANVIHAQESWSRIERFSVIYTPFGLEYINQFHPFNYSFAHIFFCSVETHSQVMHIYGQCICICGLWKIIAFEWFTICENHTKCSGRCRGFHFKIEIHTPNNIYIYYVERYLCPYRTLETNFNGEFLQRQFLKWEATPRIFGWWQQQNRVPLKNVPYSCSIWREICWNAFRPNWNEHRKTCSANEKRIFIIANCQYSV